MASETTPLRAESPTPTYTDESQSTYHSSIRSLEDSMDATSDDNLELTQRLKRIGVLWQKRISPMILIFLLVLPMVIFKKKYLEWFMYTIYAPISGIIACSIPSGGAPVAGGIGMYTIIFFKRFTLLNDLFSFLLCNSFFTRSHNAGD